MDEDIQTIIDRVTLALDNYDNKVDSFEHVIDLLITYRKELYSIADITPMNSENSNKAWNILSTLYALNATLSKLFDVRNQEMDDQYNNIFTNIIKCDGFDWTWKKEE